MGWRRIPCTQVGDIRTHILMDAYSMDDYQNRGVRRDRSALIYLLHYPATPTFSRISFAFVYIYIFFIFLSQSLYYYFSNSQAKHDFLVVLYYIKWCFKLKMRSSDGSWWGVSGQSVKKSTRAKNWGSREM